MVKMSHQIIIKDNLTHDDYTWDYKLNKTREIILNGFRYGIIFNDAEKSFSNAPLDNIHVFRVNNNIIVEHISFRTRK